MAKWKKDILIFGLPFTAFSFLIMYIGIYIYRLANKNPEEFSSVLDTAAKALNSTPIYEIIIIPSTTTQCPNGYEIQLLKDWPGVSPKCRTTSRTSTRCEGRVNQANIYVWRSQKFCVKRNQSPYYTINSNCQNGFTFCSANNLCVKNSEKCPISKIEIQSGTANGADTLTFNSTHKLVMQRNIQNSQPIIDIKYSPNGLPCFANHFTPSHSSDFDRVNFRRGCGQFGQNEIMNSVIDKQIEFNLLNENGVDLSAQDGLIEAHQQSTSWLIISSFPKIKLTEQCINADKNHEELMSSAYQYDQNLPWVVTNMAFVIVLFSFTFLNFLLFPKTSKLCYGMFTVAVSMLAFVFGILMYVSLAKFMSRTNKYKNNKTAINDYLKLDCFEITQYSSAANQYEEFKENINLAQLLYIFEGFFYPAINFGYVCCMFGLIAVPIKLRRHGYVGRVREDRESQEQNVNTDNANINQEEVKVDIQDENVVNQKNINIELESYNNKGNYVENIENIS